MSSFFERFSHDDAELIESCSRLIYELRENRKQLLDKYASEDEAAMIDKLAKGELSEHPAYEHYLSARILADIREETRAGLFTILREAKLN